MSAGERRREPRAPADVLGFAVEGVLRPGLDVAVVDLSHRGARVEGGAGCRPGARTEISLATNEGRRWQRPCEVVWCVVVGVAPLRFQMGVAFEARCAGSG